jgi:hypothetical protein
MDAGRSRQVVSQCQTIPDFSWSDKTTKTELLEAICGSWFDAGTSWGGGGIDDQYTASLTIKLIRNIFTTKKESRFEKRELEWIRKELVVECVNVPFPLFRDTRENHEFACQTCVSPDRHFCLLDINFMRKCWPSIVTFGQPSGLSICISFVDCFVVNLMKWHRNVLKQDL